MKRKNIVLAFLLFMTNVVNAQEVQSLEETSPVPVEAMLGDKAGMYQMVLSKRISPESRFGYFNLINYEVDYKVETPDNYVIQSILTYGILKNVEIGAGANLKAHGGFKPLLAINYSRFTQNSGFLIQPSYELHKDGVGEIFSLFEWHPQSDKMFQPYFRLQLLTTFRDTHVYSYHYWRLGLQYKMLQFGPALNTEHIGEDFETHTNLGVFINLNL